MTRQPEHEGELSLLDQYDQEFKRSVVSVYLRRLDDGTDVLPPLRDAVVRWIGGGVMSISGMETDGLTRKCVAQSWFVRVLGERPAREPA